MAILFVEPQRWSLRRGRLPLLWQRNDSTTTMRQLLIPPTIDDRSINLLLLIKPTSLLLESMHSRYLLSSRRGPIITQDSLYHGYYALFDASNALSFCISLRNTPASLRIASAPNCQLGSSRSDYHLSASSDKRGSASVHVAEGWQVSAEFELLPCMIFNCLQQGWLVCMVHGAVGSMTSVLGSKAKGLIHNKKKPSGYYLYLTTVRQHTAPFSVSAFGVVCIGTLSFRDVVRVVHGMVGWMELHMFFELYGMDWGRRYSLRNYMAWMGG